MDKNVREQDLAQAEEDVASGAARVALQRELVAILKQGGHDIREPLALLEHFEKLYRIHVARRDRFLAQVGDNSEPT